MKTSGTLNFTQSVSLRVHFGISIYRVSVYGKWSGQDLELEICQVRRGILVYGRIVVNERQLFAARVNGDGMGYRLAVEPEVDSDVGSVTLRFCSKVCQSDHEDFNVLLQQDRDN